MNERKMICCFPCYEAEGVLRPMHKSYIFLKYQCPKCDHYVSFLRLEQSIHIRGEGHTLV